MSTLSRIALAACLLVVAIAAAARGSVAAPMPGPIAPIPDSELPKTDAGWKARLAPEQYRVLREHGTEPANSGAFVDNHQQGVYHCAGCGEPLFDSSTKFESGTGWPSFFDPIRGKVASSDDTSLGMSRTEVHCARCGGHLGHVFDDGPQPTGKRYCLNSAALTFAPATGEKPAAGERPAAGGSAPKQP